MKNKKILIGFLVGFALIACLYTGYRVWFAGSPLEQADDQVFTTKEACESYMDGSCVRLCEATNNTCTTNEEAWILDE